MIFETLERCPKCDTKLSGSLCRAFWQEDGIDRTHDFQWVCEGCGANLEIRVQYPPLFYCTLKDNGVQEKRGWLSNIYCNLTKRLLLY